ncbi:hypothetical protein [Streptomyces sp. NPDC059224]|uniref:hypothetical protein n=1 Tax=Streptomyces sp. NPDC059224 TaxID=3346775 RepID=UPI00369BC3F3
MLAAHRVEPRAAIGGDRPRVLCAGRLSRPAGGLPGLAAGAPYLTAVPGVPVPVPDLRRPRAAPGVLGHPLPAGRPRGPAARGGRCPTVAPTAGAALLPAVTAGSLPPVRPPAPPGEPIG